MACAPRIHPCTFLNAFPARQKRLSTGKERERRPAYIEPAPATCRTPFSSTDLPMHWSILCDFDGTISLED
ncbi:phosphatase, partial [Stenotrophomonas maltophilia]